MKTKETYFEFFVDDASLKKMRTAIEASKVVAGEAEYKAEECGAIFAQIKLNNNGNWVCIGAYMPPDTSAKLRALILEAWPKEII